MNELIIGGICLAGLLILCAITAIAERTEEIGEWLFDLGTSYYMHKARRARAKR